MKLESKNLTCIKIHSDASLANLKNSISWANLSYKEATVERHGKLLTMDYIENHIKVHQCFDKWQYVQRQKEHGECI